MGRVDLYDIATWEVRTPLDSLVMWLTRTGRAMKGMLVVALTVLLLLVQGVFVFTILSEEPFLGVLAISSVIPALALAGYLWYGDPTRREPLPVLAVTFVLSMVFAGIAGVVNSAFGPSFQAFGLVGLIAFYFVVVGPIEEFVKWLAIRVYAYRGDAFGTVVDGVVYGAVAGLGFAAIENLLYIATVYAEAGQIAGIAPGDAARQVAAQRFFVGPGHVVFSAWAGFYLGLAKFNPQHRGPLVLKGLLIAAFIPARSHSLVTVLPAVLPTIALFGFILLFHSFWFLLLYRKVRAYRELYRARFSTHGPGPPEGQPAGQHGGTRQQPQSGSGSAPPGNVRPQAANRPGQVSPGSRPDGGNQAGGGGRPSGRGQADSRGRQASGGHPDDSRSARSDRPGTRRRGGRR